MTDAGRTWPDLARLRYLHEMAVYGGNPPYSPGPGNNDGRIRDRIGYVVADCQGHEARTEYLAAVLNTMPALLERVARLEAAVAVLADAVQSAPEHHYHACYLGRDAQDNLIKGPCFERCWEPKRAAALAARRAAVGEGQG